MDQIERKSIQFLLSAQNGDQVAIAGWITGHRGSKDIYFFEINDGSTFESVQIVCKKDRLSNFEQLENIRLGASVAIEGEFIAAQNRKQSFEILAKRVTLLQNTSEEYPLQKKATSREFLREIPHLRHRTNLMRAVMLIRSNVLFHIHKFFKDEEFINFASPIITGNDGEGAGESFAIAAVNNEQFFGAKATLGVTGQLQAEAYANGFGKVYTFAPTFRAEKSHTQKHLAEFWMLEPEVCFWDLNQIIDLAERLLKDCVATVLRDNRKELEFLTTQTRPDLITHLEHFLKSKLTRITYAEAVEILKKVNNVFEEKNIFFGMDLKTEHERYLAEKHFKSPVAVTNYPKDIKAFYMYLNDDNQTVKCFDLLIPGVGELIGGSQRENRIDKLVAAMKNKGIPQQDLQWYLDIRGEGYPGSSGFGLGFERLIMYLTGIENIKDTIPFPRAHNLMVA